MSVLSDLLKRAESLSKPEFDLGLSLTIFLEQRHNVGKQALASGWASVCYRYCQCHGAALFPTPDRKSRSSQASQEETNFKQFLAVIDQFYCAYLFLAHLNRCRSRQQLSPFLLQQGADELFVYLVERLGDKIVDTVRAGVSSVAQHKDFKRLMRLNDVSDLGVVSHLTPVKGLLNNDAPFESELKLQQWDAGVGLPGYDDMQPDKPGAESDEERYSKLIQSGDCRYSTVQAARRYLEQQSHRQLRFASVHQIMFAAMEYLYLDRERSYFFQAGSNRKKRVIDLIVCGQAFLDNHAEINLNCQSVALSAMQEQWQDQLDHWKGYVAQWQSFIEEESKQREQSSSLLLQCLGSDELKGVVFQTGEMNTLEQDLLFQRQRDLRRVRRNEQQFAAHMEQASRRARRRLLQENSRVNEENQTETPQTLVPQLQALLLKQKEAVLAYENYRQSRLQWRVNKNREDQVQRYYKAVTDLLECQEVQFFDCYQSYVATMTQLKQEVGHGGAFGGSVFKRDCLGAVNALCFSSSEKRSPNSESLSVRKEMFQLFKHNVARAMKTVSDSKDIMQIKALFNYKAWPLEDRQAYGKFLCDQLIKTLQQQPMSKWNHLLRDLVRVGSSMDSSLLPYFEETVYWPSIREVYSEQWQFGSWVDESSRKKAILDGVTELSGLYRSLKSDENLGKSAGGRLDIFRGTVTGPLLSSLLATDQDRANDNTYRVFDSLYGVAPDSLRFLNEVLGSTCFDWVRPNTPLEVGKTLVSCLQKQVDCTFDAGRYKNGVFNQIAGVLGQPVVAFKSKATGGVEVVEQLRGRDVVPVPDDCVDPIAFNGVGCGRVDEWLGKVVRLRGERLEGFLNKETFELLHQASPLFVCAYAEGRVTAVELQQAIEVYRNALLYGVKDDLLDSQEVSDFVKVIHSMNELLGDEAVPLWKRSRTPNVELDFNGKLRGDIDSFPVVSDQVLLSLKTLSALLKINPELVSPSDLRELLSCFSEAVLNHDFSQSYTVMRVHEIVNVYQDMVAAISDSNRDLRSTLKMKLDVSVICWSLDTFDEMLKKVELGLLFIKSSVRPEGQALDDQWLQRTLLDLDQFIHQGSRDETLGRHGLSRALQLHESLLRCCWQRGIQFGRQQGSIASLNMTYLDFQTTPLAQLNFKMDLAVRAGVLGGLLISPRLIRKRLLQGCDQALYRDVSHLVDCCDKEDALSEVVPCLDALDSRDFRQICEVFKIRYWVLQKSNPSSSELDNLKELFLKKLALRLVGPGIQYCDGLDLELYLKLFTVSYPVVSNEEYIECLLLLQKLVTKTGDSIHFRYPHEIKHVVDQARDAFFTRCDSMAIEQVLFCEQVFAEISGPSSHLTVDPCVADFSCLSFSSCEKLLKVAKLKFENKEKTGMSANDLKCILNGFMARAQVLDSVDEAVLKQVYDDCFVLLGADVTGVVSLDLDQWPNSAALFSFVKKAGDAVKNMITCARPLYSFSTTQAFLLKVKRRVVESILTGHVEPELVGWFNSILQARPDISIPLMNQSAVSLVTQFSKQVLSLPKQIESFNKLSASLGGVETSFMMECMCSLPQFSRRLARVVSQVLNEVIVSKDGRIDVGQLERYESFLSVVPSPVLADVFSRKINDYQRMIRFQLEHYKKIRPQSPKSVQDDVGSAFELDGLIQRLKHTLDQVLSVQKTLSSSLDFEGLQLYYKLVFPTTSFGYLPFSCRQGFVQTARGHSRQLKSTSSLLFKSAGKKAEPARLRSLSCKPDMLSRRSTFFVSDGGHYTCSEREKVEEDKRQVDQVISGLAVIGLVS